MAEQSKPSSREHAPDPSYSYERSHPGREAGMGKLDNEGKDATPENTPDKSEDAATNKQDGSRQINAHDVVKQPPRAD
jgi:hypothetical protein